MSPVLTLLRSSLAMLLRPTLVPSADWWIWWLGRKAVKPRSSPPPATTPASESAPACTPVCPIYQSVSPVSSPVFIQFTGLCTSPVCLILPMCFTCLVTSVYWIHQPVHQSVLFTRLFSTVSSPVYPIHQPVHQSRHQSVLFTSLLHL